MTVDARRCGTVWAFLGLIAGGACSQQGGAGVPLVALSPRPSVAISTPPGSSDGVRARQILFELDARYREVKTWRATIVSQVYGPAAGYRDWTRCRVVFRRPATMAAQVLEARDSKFVNTRLVYSGGDQIRLRTYFFGFIPLTLDFKVTDSRLLDSYKRTFKDTQTRQWFDVLLHPQAQAVWLGEGEAASEAVDWVAVRSPASWPGVGREVFGIAKRNHLPVSREVFDGRERRMLHVELQAMQVNPALDPELFVL